MTETAGVALATFFAVIGPLDVAAMFAVLTANQTAQQKRSIAIRGSLISTGILVAFALIGELLLAGLGISLAALRAAGVSCCCLLALKWFLHVLQASHQQQMKRSRKQFQNQTFLYSPWLLLLLPGRVQWAQLFCLWLTRRETLPVK